MRTYNTAYRFAVGIALAAAFILIWAEPCRWHHRGFGRPRQLDVYRGARRRNHRCHRRALPATWDGTRVVRDGARSGVGRRDRADLRVGRPVERAGRDLGVEWVLRRGVCRISLAVSECCAGATSRLYSPECADGRCSRKSPLARRDYMLKKKEPRDIEEECRDEESGCCGVRVAGRGDGVTR
jgi:hypothetical protein